MEKELTASDAARARRISKADFWFLELTEDIILIADERINIMSAKLTRILHQDP